LDTSELEYALPTELIAQEPAPRRTDARLLLLPRSGKESEHRRVADLPGLLRPGDLVVLNDTRVVAARVGGRRPTGGRLELLFVRPLDDARVEWDVLLRGAPRVGENVELPQARGRWMAGADGRWRIAVDVEGGVDAWLERVGEVPLPPYIRREHGPTALDRERYQTVVARHPGAVAAPTAGLHFTTELLAALAEAGVEHAMITLHVGPGTFLPIRAGSLDEFSMEAEPYEIPEATAAAVVAARARGGRIVAVGTTTCRALEAAAARGALEPGPGWARLFIRPGHRFRAIDGLLTNFHLPGTPLLALVSALVGWPRLRAAYEDAIARGYRFYSYGDAMLLV
jgi:S-adenosylmethionine:tRNA ribosyltransferase-isomerase